MNKNFSIILKGLITLCIIILMGAFFWFFKMNNNETTSLEATKHPSEKKASDLASKKIVYLQEAEHTDNLELWMLDTHTKKVEYTGHSFKPSDNYPKVLLSQSPDLEHVCMIYGSKVDNEEVYLFTIADKTLQQLTELSFPVTEEHDGSNMGLCLWDPHSTKFYFTLSQSSHQTTESGHDFKFIGFPPKDLRDRTGRYIFDIKTHLLQPFHGYPYNHYERLNGEESTFVFPFGEETITIVHTLKRDEKDYKVRSISHKGALDLPNPIYEEREYFPSGYGAVTTREEPSQTFLSPNYKKVAFIEREHHLTVIADGEKTIYKNTDVHGKFYWISDYEIAFWQPQNGKDFFTDNEEWHKGNIMLLDTRTGDVINLTNTNKVYLLY